MNFWNTIKLYSGYPCRSLLSAHISEIQATIIIKLCMHLFRLWPSYASAHNNLGTLVNDTELSEKHFLSAIMYASAHINAHYNLGQLYLWVINEFSVGMRQKRDIYMHYFSTNGFSTTIAYWYSSLSLSLPYTLCCSMRIFYVCPHVGKTIETTKRWKCWTDACHWIQHTYRHTWNCTNCSGAEALQPVACFAMQSSSIPSTINCASNSPIGWWIMV